MHYWQRKRQAASRLSCRVCLFKEGEPEPAYYFEACSSKPPDAWMEAMASELDGLRAVETLLTFPKLPRVALA